MGTSELRAVVVRGVRDAERCSNERRHGDQTRSHGRVRGVPQERCHDGLLQAALYQPVPRQVCSARWCYVLPG